MRIGHRGHLALWLGWLGAPSAWLAHLSLVYALSDGACHGHRMAVLHLATVIVLGVVGLGALSSWLRWRDSSPDAGDLREKCEHFMATQGLLMCSLFAAVILAEWSAVFLLDPCPL